MAPEPHLNHITSYLRTSTLILLAVSCPRKLQLDVSLVPSLRSLLSTFGLQAWGLHPRRMASGASSLTFLLHMASASTMGSQRRSFHSITLPLMMLSSCSSSMAFVVLMAEVDLKSAFCMVPVRAEDWDLLGMYWQGRYYVDTCVPFVPAISSILI